MYTAHLCLQSIDVLLTVWSACLCTSCMGSVWGHKLRAKIWDPRQCPGLELWLTFFPLSWLSVIILGGDVISLRYSTVSTSTTYHLWTVKSSSLKIKGNKKWGQNSLECDEWSNFLKDRGAVKLWQSLEWLWKLCSKNVENACSLTVKRVQLLVKQRHTHRYTGFSIHKSLKFSLSRFQLLLACNSSMV